MRKFEWEYQRSYGDTKPTKGAVVEGTENVIIEIGNQLLTIKRNEAVMLLHNLAFVLGIEVKKP